MAITNPVVNKVFNDLEEFRDFCRTELDYRGDFWEWNEANLYNEKSRVWTAFVKWRGWMRAKARPGYKKVRNA
jgi:hypothetical protein